eukprot:47824-Chlamydomonas_euryale.AAC.2
MWFVVPSSLPLAQVATLPHFSARLPPTHICHRDTLTARSHIRQSNDDEDVYDAEGGPHIATPAHTRPHIHTCPHLHTCRAVPAGWCPRLRSMRAALASSTKRLGAEQRWRLKCRSAWRTPPARWSEFTRRWGRWNGMWVVVWTGGCWMVGVEGEWCRSAWRTCLERWSEPTSRWRV